MDFSLVVLIVDTLKYNKHDEDTNCHRSSENTSMKAHQ